MKKHVKTLAVVGILILSITVLLKHKSIRKAFRYFYTSPKKAERVVKLEDYVRLVLPDLESSQWLSRYSPDKAFNGYNLVLLKRRIPLLLDMNGNIVHAWPKVKGRARLYLTKEGNLLLICSDNKIREYDWDGHVTWQYSLNREEDFPHHDLKRMKNGNVLLVCRDWERTTDYLLEVNREGDVVWEWRSGDYLEKYFKGKVTDERDPTHINSVQELPDNRRYEEGDTRFRPGNILVSARNLNTIFVIDRKTGDVVWQYSEGLDYQHEALMIEKGYPGDGNILFFNNGYNNYYRYRRSSIEELDLLSETVKWQYSSKYFFSSKGGIEQNLPNGNIFISSTKSGRAFEITREGEIVWEWSPPFDPGRPVRYPYDHCPQFEKLGEPVEVPVPASGEQPFIDHDLYAFGLEPDVDLRHVYGKKRKMLKSKNLCRTLIIPENAILKVGYGLDTIAMEEHGISNCNALFTVELKPQGFETGILLLEDTVSSNDDTLWVDREVMLKEYTYQTVLMCLDVKSQDNCYLWENPKIAPEDQNLLDANMILENQTGREKEILRQRLKALGYVD